MTIPDEFEDINEAVGSEWEDGTTPVERVHDVINHRYTPTSADEIAETARTSTETAQKCLDDLVDDGFVTTETDENGTTIYRRSPRSIVIEQATEILDNTSMDELAARVSEMRDRVEHEDSEDTRDWQTTRRNLAFANTALAIAEATRVIDEDELDAEIGELERELADRVDKD